MFSYGRMEGVVGGRSNIQHADFHGARFDRMVIEDSRFPYSAFNTPAGACGPTQDTDTVDVARRKATSTVSSTVLVVDVFSTKPDGGISSAVKGTSGAGGESRNIR